MNKTDLIKHLAERCNLTRRGAAECLDATFDAIAESLTGGEKVVIPGFGTFSVVEKAATTKSAFGKTVQVPAKTAVKFKAGSGLKGSVA